MMFGILIFKSWCERCMCSSDVQCSYWSNDVFNYKWDTWVVKIIGITVCVAMIVGRPTCCGVGVRGEARSSQLTNESGKHQKPPVVADWCVFKCV